MYDTSGEVKNEEIERLVKKLLQLFILCQKEWMRKWEVCCKGDNGLRAIIKNGMLGSF